MSCDLSKYGDNQTSTAITNGVLGGLAGMFGLGDFWQTKDNGLSLAQNQFSDLKTKLDGYISSQKQLLTDEETKFFNEQLILMKSIEKYNEEIMNEKITENQVLISIIFVCLIIIIIYIVIS